MKKKLVVCGCSWMTPDHLGRHEWRDNHHSELFAKKYNYEQIEELAFETAAEDIIGENNYIKYENLV